MCSGAVYSLLDDVRLLCLDASVKLSIGKTAMLDNGLLQFATATTLPSYNAREQLQESEVTDNTEAKLC
jgi:hypothetical protein